MAERLILVIMIDALGHRIVRESGTFDFLEAPDGSLPSVCGYSSACIPSIFTGKLPVEHGHWAMYLRDPEHSVFRPFRPLIWLTSGILGRQHFTRRLITRGVHHAGISGYFSLYEVPPHLLPQFDLCEKRDIFSPGAFPGLQTPFDAARAWRLRMRVWSWRTPEEQNRAELSEAIRRGDHDMLFFYSPLLDGLMHAHGTRSDATRKCLEDFASFTREMLAAAKGAYRETRLLVFGDHGMADTVGTYDLLSKIEQLPLRVPQDFLYFVDSTMARFWFFERRARDQVEALLSTVKCGRVLEDAECDRLGILFPDRRYGELVFLADPGMLLVPSFMGKKPLAAMHGYHPEDGDSDTILLCNYSHAQIHSTRDIGPLLVSELAAMRGTAGETESPGSSAGEGSGAGEGSSAGERSGAGE
ncbi:MAG: alkaline phosphatase family protein [Candidatus Eisenbacteria sp.]|nr:alkaline phosphatase family protein [Candidatus Eisenbacteria bacterium]